MTKKLNLMNSTKIIQAKDGLCLRIDQDVRSDNTRFIIVKNKGKFSMYAKSDKSGEIVFHFGDKPTLDDAKAFASIRKWQEKK